MSLRPRILMLTTQLGYGGAETSFIRLANMLAQSMDVTVTLFTSDYGAGGYTKGHEPLNAAVVLLDAPQPCGRFMRWLRRLRALRALKATHDVAISFLSGPNVLNAVAGYPARTVISLRGSRRYDPVSPTLRRLVFQHLLDPIAFALAARIVPVSAGLIHEILGGTWVRHKVVTIPPFIRRNDLQQALAQPLPQPYQTLKGQKVIVAVGRLSVEKGFHHLIHVFNLMRISQTDIKLLLIGDGPMLPALRSLCDTLGLPMDDMRPDIASVLFAGYQKNVMPLMALGSVYALSSATEGFPSVLLEAMAAGVPVVAADTPWGARSILRDEDPANRNPYPTSQPMPAAFGTLMPRIDLPRHHAAWVEVLTEHLCRSRTANSNMQQRVDDFELAKIGQQWRALIEAMGAR